MKTNKPHFLARAHMHILSFSLIIAAAGWTFYLTPDSSSEHFDDVICYMPSPVVDIANPAAPQNTAKQA